LLEFVFLGTSSGVPTIHRNVSGLVLKCQHRKSWCLVDCGEGTQHRLLKTPFSLAGLSAIFITHVHGDHSYGLPGLLASASMSARSKPLLIVAPRAIEEFICHTIRCTDMHISYDLNFKNVEPGQRYVIDEDFVVTSHALSHRVDSYAYKFNELVSQCNLNVEKLERENVPKGKIWGQIAKLKNVMLNDGRKLVAADYVLAPRRGGKIVIGGDNDTPSLLDIATRDADVLVHEATYTEKVCELVGPGPQHSSAARVAKFAQSQQVPNLVLTHFSARYHSNNGVESICELEQEAKLHYSRQLFLANDFDHFQLCKDGRLIRVEAE